MYREYTASVYILDQDRILLIYHNKLQKWLPPGGHVEANETPHEAAQREAKEETGLDIVFIAQENVWVEYWNAHSIPRPYLCLLENIPAWGDSPAHQHIDFVFVSRPLVPHAVLEAAHQSRWFDRKELEQLTPDKEIFAETLEIINHLWQCPR